MCGLVSYGSDENATQGELPSTVLPSNVQTLYTTPSLPSGLSALASLPDAAATDAETLFFSIARSLHALRPERRPNQAEGKADDDESIDDKSPNASVTVGEAQAGTGADVFSELRFWAPLDQDEDVEENENL